MKLTFSDVADRIEAVLSGELSRIDADHWFIEVVDNEAAGSLVFDPASDADRIMRGVWCLQALDLTHDNGTLVVSDVDLRLALQALAPGSHA
jgi:hypothetical protein